jgi:hypothetical protein
MSRHPSANRDLSELPEGMRWREWMARVEARSSPQRSPFRARRSPRWLVAPAGSTRSPALSSGPHHHLPLKLS